ncbi:alpha/beta hydrolase family protein [Nocardia sp. NPDC088792]|uniref:alpha/beta hydrolase family protein n=1 Tax=Nocardia sp. NPDC088792 TaxID=3364332 RepID=UPI003817F175
MGIRMAVAVGLAAGSVCWGQAAADVPAVEHEAFTFQFGPVSAGAELDYPAGARNAPVVVLIPGSGPEDRDADIPTAHDGTTHIFRDIADELTAHGYAVMRYDKRFVREPHVVDPRFDTDVDLNDFRSDAEQVLRAAEQDSHIDPHRVFLYGWSEGSTVAAALAVSHPELAGAVFQGSVAAPWRLVFAYQTEQVEAAYLQRYSVDGLLGPDELRRAYTGEGGAVARSAVGYATVDASHGDFTVAPYFDSNHDGKLDVNLEFRPVSEQYLDRLFASDGFIYGPGKTLPTVPEQAPKLTGPVLILQGRDDANVPAEGASALDAALALAGNRDHTLRVLPGLGHSLGRTPDVLADDFQPIDATALSALTQWLDAHTT